MTMVRVGLAEGNNSSSVYWLLRIIRAARNNDDDGVRRALDAVPEANEFL